MHVAGCDGEESIWQPEWSPTGDLVFASDRSGWWNLECVRAGRRSVLYEAEAEFGYPAWVFGTRSFAFLEDGDVCDLRRRRTNVVRGSRSRVTTLEALELAYDALELTLGCGGRRYGVVSRGIGDDSERAGTARRFDGIDGDALAELARAVDPSHFSVPRAIEFPAEDGLTAHALFYSPSSPAPRSGRRAASVDRDEPWRADEQRDPDLQPRAPVLDEPRRRRRCEPRRVHGYGRAYRERLNQQWGVVDLQDCVNAARYLVSEGEADGERLLIRGGSAGGYTTICALTFTDDSPPERRTTGSPTSGSSAVARPTSSARYEHTLVGPYPEAAEVYPRPERDPLRRPDTDADARPPGRRRHGCPALPGRADRRCAPSAGSHAYLLFEGEGHGFRKAETVVASLEAELSFYAQILGFEPGDSIPRLEIEHLLPDVRGGARTAECDSRPMQSFVIEGGRTLSGTVRAAGNKNGALPILAATVLASDEVRPSNVPGSVTWRQWSSFSPRRSRGRCRVDGDERGRVDPGSVSKTDLDPALAREIRASFLLAGPLLARFGYHGASSGRRRDPEDGAWTPMSTPSRRWAPR